MGCTLFIPPPSYTTEYKRGTFPHLPYITHRNIFSTVHTRCFSSTYMATDHSLPYTPHRNSLHSAYQMLSLCTHGNGSQLTLHPSQEFTPQCIPDAFPPHTWQWIIAYFPTLTGIHSIVHTRCFPSAHMAMDHSLPYTPHRNSLHSAYQMLSFCTHGNGSQLTLHPSQEFTPQCIPDAFPLHTWQWIIAYLTPLTGIHSIVHTRCFPSTHMAMDHSLPYTPHRNSLHSAYQMLSLHTHTHMAMDHSLPYNPHRNSLHSAYQMLSLHTHGNGSQLTLQSSQEYTPQCILDAFPPHTWQWIIAYLTSLTGIHSTVHTRCFPSAHMTMDHSLPYIPHRNTLHSAYQMLSLCTHGNGSQLTLHPSQEYTPQCIPDAFPLHTWQWIIAYLTSLTGIHSIVHTRCFPSAHMAMDHSLPYIPHRNTLHSAYQMLSLRTHGNGSQLTLHPSQEYTPQCIPDAFPPHTWQWIIAYLTSLTGIHSIVHTRCFPSTHMAMDHSLPYIPHRNTLHSAYQMLSLYTHMAMDHSLLYTPPHHTHTGIHSIVHTRCFPPPPHTHVAMDHSLPYIPHRNILHSAYQRLSLHTHGNGSQLTLHPSQERTPQCIPDAFPPHTHGNGSQLTLHPSQERTPQCIPEAFPPHTHGNGSQLTLQSLTGMYSIVHTRCFPSTHMAMDHSLPYTPHRNALHSAYQMLSLHTRGDRSQLTLHPSQEYTPQCTPDAFPLHTWQWIIAYLTTLTGIHSIVHTRCFPSTHMAMDHSLPYIPHRNTLHSAYQMLSLHTHGNGSQLTLHPSQEYTPQCIPDAFPPHTWQWIIAYLTSLTGIHSIVHTRCFPSAHMAMDHSLPYIPHRNTLHSAYQMLSLHTHGNGSFL